MNRNICVIAFILGLVAVCWVGVGYIGSSSLALTMTVVIGAVYVTGALELRRFHLTTSALDRALAAIPENLSHLGEWLDQLPYALQNTVRLRVEGERVGLPGPAVTPYLVGLLVLLGMLGTFLGMVVTLNGAVIALESTTDLQTIRASLAAPVKGLGVAFGTSVAGVAASAMLGLVSAMCRRARLQTAQMLDTKVATVLRRFSLSHQRQEAFKALQFQAQALPEVMDRMQAMMAQMERQSQQLNERLLASQESFHRDTRGIYADLAASVDQSLKESLKEGTRLAGESIQPVVAATMGGIARETTVLHEKLADTVKTRLDAVSAHFGSTAATVAETWTAALANHERTTENLNRGVQDSLAAYADTFDRRSAALLASVEGSHAVLRENMVTTTGEIAQQTIALHEGLATTVATQLDGLSNRLGTAVTSVADTWTAALSSHEHTSENLIEGMRQSQDALSETFSERSAALIADIRQAHAAWQAESALKEQELRTSLSQAM